MSSSSNPLAFVVEDDDKLATIYTQALKISDFDIESFSNGDAAIERLKVAQPFLVLLDLHLDGTSGNQVLDFIRKDERLKSMQVIVATADPLMADLVNSQSDFVLQKPVSFSQLHDLAVRLRSTLGS